MGKEKGGFLTPKAIANRIKAKGLQKLRWYCQMCQKQCRDENGFKCHLTSESHQRQLLLFADNPDRYIDSFSEEFKDGYLELLRRRCGTKRIHCNIIYQDYISDREHVHMNSTQWETLTEFVKWLGREGLCKVDETEKGWYVQYIDRDPETLKRQAAQEKKEKMDLDDQERAQRFLQQQIERAAASSTDKPVAAATELQRENEDEKVVFAMPASVKKTEPSKASTSYNPLESLSKLSEAKEKESKAKLEKPGEKRKANALDEIMQMEEEKKEKVNRKNYWLHPGVVVKVVTKKLGEKYHKKKAVIREVKDNYIAIVKMLDSGDKLKVDQAHLETVIPAIGKPVLIVNGAYRGHEAVLISINEKKFSCSVQLKSSLLKGRNLENIQYEDVSKLHVT